jgi:hypothetical protein
MKLETDKNAEKLRLIVKNTDGNVLSDNISWHFDDLKKAISKLSKLMIVVADTETRNGELYFHFKSATAYLDLSFEKFLNALDEGYIMFDIRIGVYKSGKNMGKPHDHGSGFRMKRDNIHMLYEEVINLE